MRTGLIITAVTAYVAILGCVIFPTQGGSKSGVNGEAPPNFRVVTTGAPLAGLPYKGVAMQLQRIDWIDKYKESLDKVAAIGFDTVLFVVDARQENGSSNRIYVDMRMTPTYPQLGELIKHAKGLKLRVILMPIVLLDLPQGNEWRGTIKPLDWEEWFNSYREMIAHYANISEVNKVDVLVVGSELVSTQDKITQWTRVIDTARRYYKGQLTYSANWDNYMHVPFWNQLDLIGMNSYWTLGRDKNAKLDEIQNNWRRIQKDVLAFTRKQNKPLLFLEVGWCSLENAAHEPWDYTRTDLKVDFDLQKRLYEGFFTTWYGNPNLGGFMVWNWKPGDIGPNDKDYTPEGKPAEKVLREWLARPWDGK